MTNHSESTGANTAQPNWDWLQERMAIAEASTPDNWTKFDQWLESELALLESEYADLVTKDSRNRVLRKQLERNR
ncbi:MAG: hypothetical protein R3C53_20240 [Pirellulaceae bacterium]